MPALSYRDPSLTLKKTGSSASERQVRDFQRDLRSLGYLREGIDGDFGTGTARAVMSLEYDLLANDGRTSGGDGEAPVRLTAYCRGRVSAVTGVAGQALVECVSDMLDDETFPKLPFSEDPALDNRRMLDQIAALPSLEVPTPFLLAILQQESGLKHFREPRHGDEDTYVVVGLDTNGPRPFAVTSRGYGAGQYTIFHHPPRAEEVRDFILEPSGNIRRVVQELRGKFLHFVNGFTPGTQATDRIAEIGRGPLRTCQYQPPDRRYMSDCRNCALRAGRTDLKAGITPLYPGSSSTYEETVYYKEANHEGVPNRKNMLCDWPYAVRRYNGAGINSYHYQAKVLRNVLTLNVAG